LYGSLAAGGFDEPAGGGGVVGGGGIVGAEEQADPAAALGGELEAADLNARQRGGLGDGGGDAAAGEALGHGPDLVLGSLRAEEEELVERDAGGGEGGGVELAAGVAPDDGGIRVGRATCFSRRPSRESGLAGRDSRPHP
jgi:hypothetical protein